MKTQQSAVAQPSDHGRIVADSSPCLDPLQLERLEKEFRSWAEDSRRSDILLSRQRVLLIFLLIRFTGAKLSEVLTLNPVQDIDPDQMMITFGHATADGDVRTVPISETLSREIRRTLSTPGFEFAVSQGLGVDPGFIRRKFYERAEACGFPKHLGAPEMIRKSRGIELMQSNMPLPAVQMYLGHSTPNLTSAYVSFSEDEIRTITSSFLAKETDRKTSARNAFFGKVSAIQHGDIQATVKLTTLDGLNIATVITTDSLERLGLKPGRLATAEVKAPWITLHKGETEPLCSAENRLCGTITRIQRGTINTEYSLSITQTTMLCALASTESLGRLKLQEGDTVWALFNSYAAILHVEY